MPRANVCSPASNQTIQQLQPSGRGTRTTAGSGKPKVTLIRLAVQQFSYSPELSPSLPLTCLASISPASVLKYLLFSSIALPLSPSSLSSEEPYNTTEYVELGCCCCCCCSSMRTDHVQVSGESMCPPQRQADRDVTTRERTSTDPTGAPPSRSTRVAMRSSSPS